MHAWSCTSNSHTPFRLQSSINHSSGPLTWPRPLPSTSFPIHCSSVILPLDAMQSELRHWHWHTRVVKTECELEVWCHSLLISPTGGREWPPWGPGCYPRYPLGGPHSRHAGGGGDNRTSGSTPAGDRTRCPGCPYRNLVTTLTELLHHVLRRRSALLSAAHYSPPHNFPPLYRRFAGPRKATLSAAPTQHCPNFASQVSIKHFSLSDASTKLRSR